MDNDDMPHRPDVRAALTELVAAMRRYEAGADGDQPIAHRAMMERADAALAAPVKEGDPLQQLADQAQALDMGYGPNACPTCGRSGAVQELSQPVATYCGVEFTRYTIEWTNGPLPVGTKLYAAQPVPAVDQTMLAMADCMDMVRRDLIDMGIIDKRVAPMFIPEAVARYVKSAILAVPQGYKLVPVEPTEAMIRAGCLNQATDKFANLREMLRDDFVAMVAASPVVR